MSGVDAVLADVAVFTHVAAITTPAYTTNTYIFVKLVVNDIIIIIIDMSPIGYY